MRRVFFALAAWLFLFCCGCQKSTDEAPAQPIASAFSATVSIAQGEFSCTAAVTKSADGTFETVLETPTALKGLAITQTDETCSFAFAGLTLETPPSLLPDAAFSSCMLEAVETLQESTRFVTAEHGDNIVYSGRTKNGDLFTFTQEKETGKPLSLEFSDRQLTITFTDYQESKT